MFKMKQPREATNRLLEMLDEGLIDGETLARAALNFMSEAEVAGMACSEGFIVDDDSGDVDNDDDVDGDDEDDLVVLDGDGRDWLADFDALGPLEQDGCKDAIVTMHREHIDPDLANAEPLIPTDRDRRNPC